MLRADCADMLRQVEAAQPTIVLKAVDAKGADVTDVSVDLNGKRLVSSLDGRAIAVDPGKLSLVFARPPAKPVTVTVMIGEGEKSHIVQANLEPLAAPTTSTPPGSDPDDRTRPRAIRSVAGWAVPGGFAALGAAAFAYAGITRLSLESEANDLRRTCGPTCLQEDRDRLSGELVTVNIMLGVAITSVALAAASWFVLGPKNAGGRTRTAGSAW